MQFSDFELNEKILRSLKDLGFFAPNDVQERFIPMAKNGADVLCKSETGSGKTLAYVLPIVNAICSLKDQLESENQSGTKFALKALVCAPTKELVLQIKHVFDDFCKSVDIKTCAIIGGSDFTRQRMALKTAEIVIGTTGRLLDHLDRRTIKLNNLKFFVLDEADEMLDMGFVDDIMKIEKACPKQRQNFLLSATFDEKVKNLASSFMKNPQIIEMTKDNKVVSKISQCYVLCKKNGKFETIVKFLKNLYKEKVIIFVNTKKMAEELNAKLKQKEIYCEFISGDLLLRERKRVMDRFRSGENDILIATDVASRGLDIENVNFVINYDMPQEKDIYIHRVGRTARAGKDGVSLSLINSEKQLCFLLENFGESGLVELKVKKDDRLNKYVFVKSDKKQEFDFSEKQKFKAKNSFERKNKSDKNNNFGNKKNVFKSKKRNFESKKDVFENKKRNFENKNKFGRRQRRK